MDIRHMPLGSIMQLPDYCFGRRFLCCVWATSIDAAPGFDICEIALPEQCVIWSVWFYVITRNATFDYFRLALGDQLPTASAQMMTLEPLMPGLGRPGAAPREIPLPILELQLVMKMRMPIMSAGRRVVLELQSLASQTAILQVGVEVSSIPKEVPDWVFWGTASGR